MNDLQVEKTHKTNRHEAYKCPICSVKLPFQMPDHILDDLSQGRVVIFAGAGISTESKLVWPITLYDDVRDEMAIAPLDTLGFPELMSRYCALPNGRKRLLRKIHDRLEYIRSFPGIDRFASRFHRELSTLFPVDTIVTTNWDDYFETECGAIPLVTPADFSLWDLPGRKVFKIHGSISSIGSIVATSEDYKKCYKRLRDGILGSVLKQIIGTKTLVYVGYSFRDEDFLSIHGFLKREMGAILPSAYVVTPDSASEAKFRSMGLTPIITDATYFLSFLKKHLVLEGEMLDDKRFDAIHPTLEKVLAEASRCMKNRAFMNDPNSVYVWAYTDGLIHGFERMFVMQHTGTYSHICDVVDLAKSYRDIRQAKVRGKAYFDVAYIDGYIAALLHLLADDKSRKSLPLYYIYGRGETARRCVKLKGVAFWSTNCEAW